MVICRPVVDEIQSARSFGIAAAEDRAVSIDVFVDYVGDELRYLSLIDAVGLGVIRWNVEPPSAIDVDECVRDREGGKVLYPNGMQGQKCDEQSIADAHTARASGVLANISASLINTRPASTRRSVRTSRSAFDRGIMTSAISFSISASHPKSPLGRDQLRGAAQLVDRVPDGDGADPSLQLGDEFVYVIWGDEGHRAQGRIEPTVALEKVQVQTVAVGDVGLANGGKMTCRPTALKPLPRPACLLPIRDDRTAAIPRSAAIVACPSWRAPPRRRRRDES